jgi:hypothetical protein
VSAAQAQYGTPTPTCLQCVPPAGYTRHPDTGFALALPLIVAAILVVAGVEIRRRM